MKSVAFNVIATDSDSLSPMDGYLKTSDPPILNSTLYISSQLHHGSYTATMAFRARASYRSTRPYRRRTRGRVTRLRRRRVARPRRTVRRMGRKSILNLTSRKKQDNMLSWVAQTPSPNAAGSIKADTINGAIGATYIWRCTQRDRLPNSGPDTNASALRTSDICFMRGLKETLMINSNSGKTWFWRRICFTCKGSPFGPTFTADYAAETTTEGWVRYVSNLRPPSQPDNWGPSRNAMTSVLFRGARGIDWLDPHNAKVDQQRIKVVYDKSRILRSGNAEGTMHRVKQWLPMNKNLIYDNDESAEGETTGNQSVVGPAGMGDYYVCDFIDCALGTSTDTLSFLPQATLYWHER
uniref:Capsid protein n=1 Tax=Giant panda feces-associated gemycircularvirus TaxID=2864014 RepID=A0A8K1HHS2_9VIRU|nr:capsid protein [Giant panda feces-associated gemycircularvirus]